MRRRHSSHTRQPPAAEAAVKAAPFLRVHRSAAQSLDGRRSGGTPRQRPILRPRTNSCCCAGFPAPESVSARTRDGSRRKRTPPRSLHVLTFPPGTILGFHTTPQGMECQHSSGAQHRARSRDDFDMGTAFHSHRCASSHTLRCSTMSNLKLLRSNLTASVFLLAADSIMVPEEEL
jgi:hypothetical protein